MRRLLIPAVFGLTLLACGGSSTAFAGPSTPSPTPPAAATTPTPAVAATPTLESVLFADIQDEWRAEAIYARVLADFGDLRPFANIIWAERRHAEAVAGLLIARGIPFPDRATTVDSAPRFATFREACAAAYQAEVENVALYDSQMKLDLPADVRAVLQANRDASFYNHMPAFSRCR
jgi:hypothetical protein